MNVDRATLKELLQEIINTAEEGTSRLDTSVDPAAPALKEGHHRPTEEVSKSTGPCYSDDDCPSILPVCIKWGAFCSQASSPGGKA